MKIINHDLATGEITESEMTPEQIAEREANSLIRAWEQLRYQRNLFLTQSDWTVLGDSPTPTAAWKTYRQALRDLPANTTDPFNVVWPTPPS